MPLTKSRRYRPLFGTSFGEPLPEPGAVCPICRECVAGPPDDAVAPACEHLLYLELDIEGQATFVRRSKAVELSRCLPDDWDADWAQKEWPNEPDSDDAWLDANEWLPIQMSNYDREGPHGGTWLGWYAFPVAELEPEAALETFLDHALLRAAVKETLELVAEWRKEQEREGESADLPDEIEVAVEKLEHAYRRVGH